MTKPIESTVSAAFHPLTSALGRAFTVPGMGGGEGANASVAAPPTPAPPAQSPTGSTGGAQNMAQAQLSFLTAASKAAAAMGGASSSGKSLLGQ